MNHKPTRRRAMRHHPHYRRQFTVADLIGPALFVAAVILTLSHVSDVHAANLSPIDTEVSAEAVVEYPAEAKSTPVVEQAEVLPDAVRKKLKDAGVARQVGSPS